MPKIKLAFIQTSPVFGNIEKNTADAVKRIAALDADIVVLPELFSTGYQFKSAAEALKYGEDAVSGHAASVLSAVAKKKGMFIAAGIAEKHKGKAYNSAILTGPKGFIGVYRKAHLFWHEKNIFAPGNTPFKVYDIGIAKVGMMICFDWVFPEAMRTLALKGADVILHPSNLVLPYCPDAMVTRCLENRVFAVTANRVGEEERIKGRALRFIGSSRITAPNGSVLCRAPKARVASKVIEVNINEARSKKITPLNDLFKDRRTEFFKW
jgi:predicted amidohydrolase